jgi:hypothetical protein
MTGVWLGYDWKTWSIPLENGPRKAKVLARLYEVVRNSENTGVGKGRRGEILPPARYPLAQGYALEFLDLPFGGAVPEAISFGKYLNVRAG